ncbi:MAG: serine protease [Planctomycetaceae bacterium]|nr:serine protease [Planctomycetaceae bacterium]
MKFLFITKPGVIAGLLLMTVSSIAHAQSVCLPLPRLLTTTPMGAQAGTDVEVTITGDDIDEAAELYFSHPGITATQKRDAAGAVEPNRYIVTVASDCPPGIYETRVMTRLGITSSRIFSVGNLPEVLQKKPATSLEQAMDLDVNTVCNASMTSRAVDHFRFSARKGQRYLIHCDSRGIDSKLNAVLIVADSVGRDLQVERLSGMTDFTAPDDGPCVVKVHDLTYKGGPEYFYRLSIRTLDADQPLPRFAATRTVSSFSWPPDGLPETATMSEAEPDNNIAQRIELPCDLAGSFFPAADVDTFEFMATAGDVWWVEVASERFGCPTDPSAIVQVSSGEGDQQTFTDVVEFTDITSPMKVSSNGYAYDGPPYDGGSPDIIGKLEIKQTGLHRLQLTDLFGGTRNDPSNIYRLVIRRAAPDFALAAWGLHMELRNGDRNALSKPLALRGGMTVALEVAVVRRDGFDGEIALKLDHLPEGVTAQGLTIPAGKTRGIVLITADQNAPRGLSEVIFTGQATIGETTVTRPCHMAAMTWPVRDAWGEIPRPRLVTGMPISVSGSEFAPISIAPAEKKTWEVSQDASVTIPLVHVKRSEFSGSTLQLKTFGAGFEGNPQFNVSLDAETSDVTLDLAKLKTPPGDYLIAFYGGAVVKYRLNPERVTAAESAKAIAAAEAAASAEAVAAAQAAVEASQTTSAETSGSPDAGTPDKAEPETALRNAMARKEAADKALKAAEEELKAATAAAQPKDIADIVVTEPVAVRVLPAEAK